MKKLLIILTALVFIALNIQHVRKTEAQSLADWEYPEAEPFQHVDIAHQLTVGIGDMKVLDLTTGKTTYYVKVNNTISKLVDKEGYIIAAKRLGMETILIIPDGKVYRTVSLDLHKDDEALKNAIEVKIDEIIIKS